VAVALIAGTAKPSPYRIFFQSQASHMPRLIVPPTKPVAVADAHCGSLPLGSRVKDDLLLPIQ